MIYKTMYVIVCLITVLRGMSFLPSMDPSVSLQVARVGECFIAFLAGIWFLSSMNPNVTL